MPAPVPNDNVIQMHFSGFGISRTVANSLADQGKSGIFAREFSIQDTLPVEEPGELAEDHPERSRETASTSSLSCAFGTLQPLSADDVISAALIADFRRAVAVPASQRLDHIDQAALQLHRAIDLAEEHDLLDPHFVTINLRSYERPKDVLDTLHDNIKKMLDGRPFVYSGVHVPGHGDGEGLQHHIHIIVFLPSRSRPVITVPSGGVMLDGDHRWKWTSWLQPELKAFRDRRNVRFPKSAHVQPVYCIDGLHRYLTGRTNLLSKGAKPLAARIVKGRPRPPVHFDIDQIVDIIDINQIVDIANPGPTAQHEQPAPQARQIAADVFAHYHTQIEASLFSLAEHGLDHRFQTGFISVDPAFFHS